MFFMNGRRTAELEAKLAEAEKERILAQSLLDAVNASAHLGIWTAFGLYQDGTSG